MKTKIASLIVVLFTVFSFSQAKAQLCPLMIVNNTCCSYNVQVTLYNGGNVCNGPISIFVPANIYPNCNPFTVTGPVSVPITCGACGGQTTLITAQLMTVNGNPVTTAATAASILGSSGATQPMLGCPTYPPPAPKTISFNGTDFVIN